MNLRSIVKTAVGIADSVTADVQVPVIHYAWIGSGAIYGEPLYEQPVTRMAIVELKQRQRQSESGDNIIQKASITFPRPIAPHGAAERREPVDPRDKFVLQTGFTGPILDVKGLDNTLTDSPYMIEVILG